MKYINLHGDNFMHLTGGNKGFSTHGKKSQYIRWVSDGTGSASMYVDAAIGEGLGVRLLHPKYAWLLESNPMAPEEYLNGFLRGAPEYMESFDLVFTHRRDLLERGDPFRFSPGSCTWVKRLCPNLDKKTRLTSLIASDKAMCEGHLIRLSWADRLTRAGLVDRFGRGFIEIPDKEIALESYAFSVAIENDTTPSYFSEKILDCFATGAIPIYLGTPDIGDFFNADGIIPLTDELDWESITFARAWEMRDAVQDNFERVQGYLVGEDYIWEHYLR